ncbi:MAG: cupredoxin domain-containing protein [bacterium]
MKRPMFILVVLVGLTLGACGSDSKEPSGVIETKAGQITVSMLDSSFDPATITVKAGTSVTFHLPNTGRLPHNMHIASARGVYRESPWMSETIGGGQTTQLTWDVPAETGTYLFRCDVHEAEMVGKITVE